MEAAQDLTREGSLLQCGRNLCTEPVETEQFQIASAETGCRPRGSEWVGHCCCSCYIQSKSAYVVVRQALRMPQGYRSLPRS